MRQATLEQLLAWAQAMGISAQGLVAARATLGRVKKSSLKKLGLEAGMYREAKERNMTFSDLLEEMDPSEQYEGCGLSAFERQLAVRDLQVSGSGAVTLEEWYNNPESRVLFPEFIQQQVRIGMLMGRYTLRDEDLIATTTTIDSGTYQSSRVDETQDVSAGITGQGADFPVISLTVGDATIKLKKHGLVIKQTYEHIRRLRANKMAVFLQLVGLRMMLDKTEDAVSVLINGDGNSNSAPVDTLGEISYNNFIRFLAEFESYELNTFAADKEGWISILTVPEFKDSRIAQSFINTGVPMDPFGSAVKRHDPESEILTGKILGVNRANALERIEEANANLVESDKLITSQWDKIAISQVVGYARIITNAARVWDVTNDLP